MALRHSDKEFGQRQSNDGIHREETPELIRTRATADMSSSFWEFHVDFADRVAHGQVQKFAA